MSDGIPIGYSPDGRHAISYRGSGHLLTVAAARTGKGATLLINALLSWRGSCICIDPKAENAAVTAHRRARFGKVFILNPFDMLPDARADSYRAEGMPVVAWTTRSPAEWDAVSAHCDNHIFEGFAA